MNKISVFTAVPGEKCEKDALPLLDPERRARLESVSNAEMRAEIIASGLALRAALKTFFPDKLPEVWREESGKPRADGAHISLSHTEGLAVCAICTNNIGIDIERKDRKLSDRVRKRCFTPLDEGTDMEIWTAKEAFLKYTGEGLLFPMLRIRVQGDLTARDDGLIKCKRHVIKMERHVLTVVCASDFLTEISIFKA